MGMNNEQGAREKQFLLRSIFKKLIFVVITFFIGGVIGMAEVAAAEHPAKIRMITEEGEIIAEIYTQQAPRTSAHFLRYVTEGYYNGGSFFRTARSAENQPKDAVKIDVIQAGPHIWKARSPFDPIMIETTNETGLKHVHGALSLARMTPDSGNNNFFICIGEQPELDAGGKRHPDGLGFAVFGKVTQGMDVVRRIHAAKAEGQGISSPVKIHSITLLPE